MLALAIRNWKLGLGALLGALIAFGPVYYWAHSKGRESAAVDALEKSVDILRKRNEIDEDISRSDAASLCGDFGLSDDDERECMRRLGETDAEPGDGNLYLSD